MSCALLDGKGTAYLVVLIESMHTIRRVSARLLQEKMYDSVAVSDGKAKGDIMSILVRARKADLEQDRGAYAISDKAMVDQVVCVFAVRYHEFRFHVRPVVNIPYRWP
jgi:hypothetical protein